MTFIKPFSDFGLNKVLKPHNKPNPPEETFCEKCNCENYSRDLWWQGPTCLQQPKETCPTSQFTLMKHEKVPEIKIEPLPILVKIKNNKEHEITEKF